VRCVVLFFLQLCLALRTQSKGFIYQVWGKGQAMVDDPAVAGLCYGIQACSCCMVHARASAGGARDCHKGVRGDLHAAHGGPRRAVATRPQVPQLAALPGHKHPRREARNTEQPHRLLQARLSSRLTDMRCRAQVSTTTAAMWLWSTWRRCVHHQLVNASPKRLASRAEPLTPCVCTV